MSGVTCHRPGLWARGHFLCDIQGVLLANGRVEGVVGRYDVKRWRASEKKFLL